MGLFSFLFGNPNNSKRKKSQKGTRKLEFFKDSLDNWINENKIQFKNEYELYLKNCYPNCGCILESKIKASKKCSECKEKIVLRTNRATSEKLILNEKRAIEYDNHDKKRKEILYFEDIISKRIFIYKDYMKKFYELKASAPDPRNVVFPFVNYVGSELDRIAIKEYLKIVHLSESDMALESFYVIHKFDIANMQYYLLAEICDYKGKKDIALDDYATAAYRGVQITLLEGASNPYHEIKTIDFMGKINPGVILKFLNSNGYSLDDFKQRFIEGRHPFALPQISNEESWRYVMDSIKLYLNMQSKEKSLNNLL